MSDVIQRLRDYQEAWEDAITRMDGPESGNGIMTTIRSEQHATFKKAADELSRLRAENEALRKQNERFREICAVYLPPNITVDMPNLDTAIDAAREKL